jgi:hypothetical protein
MMTKQLSLLALTILLSVSAFSQTNQKVDFTEFIKEVQKWDKNENEMSMTFWIPNAYWHIALANNPKIDEELVAHIESMFENYIFVCIADIEITSYGTMNYSDEKVLRKSLSLVDSLGNKYLPLADKELDPEMVGIIDGIRPMFAQMFGQMGEGMNFYLFEAKDKNGKNIIDENEVNTFTIKHSNKSFEYNLPIVSLMAPKACPVDNEEMKGNWNYCPIHGVKLGE